MFREREKEKKKKEGVPIPITVPYSDFLSSAETAGGQRKMRARKRKKTKEREERRREECFLDGRAMLSGRESEKCRGRETRLDSFIFPFEKGHVGSNCHVIHPKEPRVIPHLCYTSHYNNEHVREKIRIGIYVSSNMRVVKTKVRNSS